MLRSPAGEVSEAALVRDILYVFQGIDGKFIKMSGQDNCYKIDAKVPELSQSRTHTGLHHCQLVAASAVNDHLTFSIDMSFM